MHWAHSDPKGPRDGFASQMDRVQMMLVPIPRTPICIVSRGTGRPGAPPRPGPNLTCRSPRIHRTVRSGVALVSDSRGRRYGATIRIGQFSALVRVLSGRLSAELASSPVGALIAIVTLRSGEVSRRDFCRRAPVGQPLGGVSLLAYGGVRRRDPNRE
jgi:hypothetical protein